MPIQVSGGELDQSTDQALLLADLGKSNLSATTDPGVGNDQTQGYSVGSFWTNQTGTRAWICISAATGAAVWIPVLKSNLSATTDPGVGNDTTQGYSVGSTWVNTSNGRNWLCASASTGAAVWRLASQSAMNFRNVLDGGDFSINPWQRNLTALGTANVLTTAITTTTPRYFPDRWFAALSATGSILMSQIADVTVPGFTQDCQVYRSSGDTHTAVIYFGQVMESADSYQLQGQQVTFSFWAKAGANFSGGSLTVQVVYGLSVTGNDTAANMVGGSWTSQANAMNATQAITTTMTRYQFTGTVPTGATQVGVLISWTPSATAAGAVDGVLFNGLQLEIGASASEFEHRDIQVDLEICQRYCYVMVEPAAGVIVGVGGCFAAASTQVFYMALPVQMWKAPTVTLAAGAFKVAAAAAAVTATTLAAGSTHTPNAISITAANATETVGLCASLQGGTAGSGYIMASADF
jgi:hypothetical protein